MKPHAEWAIYRKLLKQSNVLEDISPFIDMNNGPACGALQIDF